MRVLLPAATLHTSGTELRLLAFDVLALRRTRGRWSRGLSTIVAALYWFHPLVWYAMRRLEEEQRRAADALAATCGIAADAYAQFVWDHRTGVWTGRSAAAALHRLGRRDPAELRVLGLLGGTADRMEGGLVRSVAAASVLLTATTLGSVMVLGTVLQRTSSVAAAPRAANSAVKAPLFFVGRRQGIEYDLIQTHQRYSRLGRPAAARAAVGSAAALADLAGRVQKPQLR